MNRSVFLYVGVLVGGFGLIAVVAFTYGHFMGVTGSGAALTLEKLPSPLRSHADAIRKAAAPCIHLKAVPATEALDLRASKFGGAPCLERGQEWPTARSGRPMTFIGQLNFGDIVQALKTQGAEVPTEMPRAGVLAFFLDMRDQVGGDNPTDQQHWAVRWTLNPQTSSQGMTIPPQVDAPKICRLEASAAKSLPGVEDTVYFPTEIQQDDLMAEYAVLVESMVGSPRHQVLGHPAIIQDDPRLDAHKAAGGQVFSGPPGYRQGPQAETIRKALSDWRLLWQIDSDKKAGVMWGDNGTVYILIRAADLKAARFDRCWVVEQCY